MRVVYDCDNTMGLPRKEVDDGLTLLYLLGRPDIELLGVTTTWGNGPLDAVLRQTRALLRRVGRTDIPILAGAGERGAPPTEAARFLAEQVAQDPGGVTVLATGPLGNLRGAGQLDPGFFKGLAGIACMGGVRRPLHIGWRDLAELNLSCDPEGAHTVLQAPCPVTLMDAHVCLQAPFRWADAGRISAWDGHMRRLLRRWLLAFGLHTGVAEFYLWDLLPAVWLSHPELFDSPRVRVGSTVQDLQTGQLRVSEGGAVLAPTRILDPAAFMATLVQAWERTHVRGSWGRLRP